MNKPTSVPHPCGRVLGAASKPSEQSARCRRGALRYPQFAKVLFPWRVGAACRAPARAIRIRAARDGGLSPARVEDIDVALSGMRKTAWRRRAGGWWLSRDEDPMEVPAGMDLLEDPYLLAAQGLLNLDTDTYRVTYDVATPLE